MEAPEGLLPRETEHLGVWMAFSRIIQTLASFAVIVFDGLILDEWNRNQVQLNHDLDLKAWVGGTPFPSLAMFTVSHLITGH